MWPVRHTFIHFQEKTSTRCNSAPPEVFVDFALAQATRRELRARRRVERRFERFSKKWVAIAQKAYAADEERVLNSVLPKQISRTTPRLRVRMDPRLYKEFAYVVLPEDKLLANMGVIRERGGEFQLWCADEPMEHPTMKLLLEYASIFNRVAASRCFHAFMENQLPIVHRLHGMKMEHIKAIIHRRWRVPPTRQLLLHLGRPLRIGMLADQDIQPGSVIQVFKREFTHRV